VCSLEGLYVAKPEGNTCYTRISSATDTTLLLSMGYGRANENHRFTRLAVCNSHHFIGQHVISITEVINNETRQIKGYRVQLTVLVQLETECKHR